MRKFISVLLLITMVFTSVILVSCEKSTDLEDYDVDDYIKLCEYKGIKIDDVVISVTDDDIAEEVDDFLDSLAESKDLDPNDEVASGDTVNINYAGYINGTFEGFTDGEEFTKYDDESGYNLVIGSNSFIDGFEDGLIGKHIGEKVTLDLVFPDTYKNNVKLQGVSVKFEVTINNATRDIMPEYTDELVAANTDYETIAEYEEYIREALSADAEEDELLAKTRSVWTYIIENTEVIKYPEAVVKVRYDELYNSYADYAASLNMTLSNFLQTQYNVTEDEFKEQIDTEVRQYIVEQMIMSKISAVENITISDAEYAEGAAKYAEGYENIADVAALEEQYGKDMIMESLLWDKVILFLVEKADIQPVTEAAE